MGKYIGIDYGKKRTGISITDDDKIISSPLITVETKDLFEFLNNYFKKEKIEIIVIGLPMRLDNTYNIIFKDIQKFAQKLKNKFKIPIHYVDERYTSKIASTIISNSHLNKMKRRNKYIVDKVSASLILETYLNLNKKINK